MNTGNFSYTSGKPAFNKTLLRIFGPIYCSINMWKMNIKVMRIEGSLPDKGTMLIASHHEDDADAFVIKAAVKRRLNWIAATRIFGKSILDNRFLKKIWDMLGIISIDANNKERNKGLFDYLAYLLGIGEAIVLFPEGNLKNERNDKRMGKAKDGVIRIAQFSQKKTGKRIPIYPIGIEYKMNGKIKEAYLRMGEPFFVKNGDNPKKKMGELIRKIAKLSNANIN